MAYTQKDNSGSIFKNERRREGKDDPEYTGSALVDGQEFWIDCWVQNGKTSQDYDPQKKTFFSLRFRPKGDQAPSKRSERREEPTTRRHAPPPPLSKPRQPQRPPQCPADYTWDGTGWKDPETGDYFF